MKLAVLGCGNMATALVGSMPFDDFSIELASFDPIFEKAANLAGDGAVDLIENLAGSDIYLIACKPQQFVDLSQQLKRQLNSDSTIISIMAGVNVCKIKSSLGVDRIVRVMPNTPALIGEGVNAIYFSPEVDLKMVELIEQLFHTTSEIFVFPEEKSIDIITGFSGSGPAYIFEIARIMIEKLVSMGITSRSANSMIKQTIYGASKLMLESYESPESLRNMVTSKKGVTSEALEVFKQNNLEQIFSNALNAAYQRAQELSDES